MLDALALIAGLAGLAPAAPPPAPPAVAGDRFVSRTRQLVFEGRRSGEGYFSADGRRLVFQAEREPGNPFFQIYVMDLGEGTVERVSTGVGKTTCAFLRPGSDEILFASTHHDPKSAVSQKAEIDLRASGQARRYEWDFDPEMDLYVAHANGGALRRLTDVRGYDAEASYSPDGRWIVFSSNRTAYTDTLDDAARSRLETDPSWFSELWLVSAAGGEPRRLTDSNGYDGGPFFTADGERIIWRRFREDGVVADVWTMTATGGDERRVTDFGAMSWAPYPHPSGRYVIFTSNKYGMSNFELFIVNMDGTKEPIRVTATDGFDGLPVFSPDGRRLAWTSGRSGRGAHIFIAQWDHDAALAALAAATGRVVATPEPKR